MAHWITVEEDVPHCLTCSRPVDTGMVAIPHPGACCEMCPDGHTSECDKRAEVGVMREECLVNTCGEICFPASCPGDGSEPFDCQHAESSHYSIDGEATGCVECEEKTEVAP